MRPIRFHDLRHTFGTQAAAAGVPIRTLQEWMGHRDYKTTLVYADYAPHTQEQEMLEGAFEALTSPRDQLLKDEPEPEPAPEPPESEAADDEPR